MSKKVLISLLASLGCATGALVGCAGAGDLVVIGDAPELLLVFPCSGNPGDRIELLGNFFLNAGEGDTTVEVGGVPVTVENLTDTKLSFVAPAGSGAKTVVVKRNGKSSTARSLKLRTNLPVIEVEPNDSINGTNATRMDGEVLAVGTLSNAADKDHFYFDCLNSNKTVKLKLTPRLVGIIYINGLAVALDANGECLLGVSQGLVGLTGATGDYTLTALEQ